MEWTGSLGDYLGASLMKLNHRNPVWNCSFPISLIKNGHFMSRIRCLLDSEGDTLGILLGFFGINRLDGRLFTVRKNRTLLSLDLYGWRQIVSNSYGTSHLIHPDRSVFSFLFFSFAWQSAVRLLLRMSSARKPSAGFQWCTEMERFIWH